MQTLIASLIVFGLIIFVHEFGHYIVAKLAGVRVEEFALGMGPKVVSTKRGDTMYSLRAFPLGGFCRMAGESGNQEFTPTAIIDPGRFDQKPVLARMGVVVAGPLMNFLLAILLFSLMFTFLGIPQGYTTTIGEVRVGSPAEGVGLQPGDKIMQINGTKVNTWSEMVEIINGNAGVSLELQVEKAGKLQTLKVTPQVDPDTKVGLIGITPRDVIWQKIGLLAGLQEGLSKTWEITAMTVLGLIEMIKGKVSSEGVAGPVGIIQLIGESARFGFIYLINLTALISINLGLLNLLPIPALDGSRLLFMLVEAVRGKPVNPSKENFVHLIGFVLLMALMLLVTYKDLVRIFT